MRTPSSVYILENEEQCYMSQVDESLLRHRRMGHLNFDNIVRISQKRVVGNLSKVIKPPNHVCRHYLHGKRTRTNFKVKEHTTPQPLELIHTDLFGSTRTKILQGEYYIILLIDDYIRMTWVTFLKEKP